MRTLILDGDIFIYKAAFGCELGVDWGKGLWSIAADIGEAVALIDQRVEELEDKFKARAVMTLSDGKANWRKDLSPDYKRQRKAVRRPTLLRPMKDHVRKTYKVYEKDTLEADDVMGILQTHSRIIRGKKMIVTIDKDLLQIPGFHFNPDKPELGVRKVSVEEGDRLHLMQSITGDSVDNYKGVPGIGAKRAARALDENGCTWETVIEMYANADLTEEDALVQARIARICRQEDYNPETKEVILWTP